MSVLELLLLAVVIPLHCVEDRQRQRVILRHVRHVVCKHVEDVAHDERVVCLVNKALCRRHIQKAEHIVLFRAWVFRVALGVHRLDGEVVLLRERAISKALHRHAVAPLAALLRHVLLQLVRHLALPLCERAVDCGDVLLRQQERIRLLDVFLSAAVLDVLHAHTAAKEMADGLLAFRQAVKRHHLRSRHLRGLSALELKRVRFLRPRLYFFRLVGLLRESHDLLRVEGHLIPAGRQCLEDRLAALAEALESVVRRRVIPAEETSHLFSSLRSAFGLPKPVELKHRRLCRLPCGLKVRIGLELVRVLDAARQDREHPVELLQLLAVHPVHNVLAWVLADDVGRSVDVFLHLLEESIRDVQIQPEVARTVLVLPAQAVQQLLHPVSIPERTLNVLFRQRTAAQRPFACKVDGFQELAHRQLQRLRDVLLIAVFQQPIAQALRLLLDARTVFRHSRAFLAACLIFRVPVFQPRDLLVAFLSLSCYGFLQPFAVLRPQLRNARVIGLAQLVDLVEVVRLLLFVLLRLPVGKRSLLRQVEKLLKDLVAHTLRRFAHILRVRVVIVYGVHSVQHIGNAVELVARLALAVLVKEFGVQLTQLCVNLVNVRPLAVFQPHSAHVPPPEISEVRNFPAVSRGHDELLTLEIPPQVCILTVHRVFPDAHVVENVVCEIIRVLPDILLTQSVLARRAGNAVVQLLQSSCDLVHADAASGPLNDILRGFPHGFRVCGCLFRATRLPTPILHAVAQHGVFLGQAVARLQLARHQLAQRFRVLHPCELRVRSAHLRSQVVRAVSRLQALLLAFRVLRKLALLLQPPCERTVFLQLLPVLAQHLHLAHVGRVAVRSIGEHISVCPRVVTQLVQRALAQLPLRPPVVVVVPQHALRQHIREIPIDIVQQRAYTDSRIGNGALKLRAH